MSAAVLILSVSRPKRCLALPQFPRYPHGKIFAFPSWGFSMSVLFVRRAQLHVSRHLLFALLTAACCCQCTFVQASDWRVPFAGNAFCTSPGPESNQLENSGLRLQSAEDIWSVYIHVDRAALLQLSLDAAADKSATLQVDSDGTKLECGLDPATPGPYALGQIQADGSGYMRLNFRGVSKTGKSYGLLKNLLISSTTPELSIDFVRDNKGGMFHWGRRGPSVHLNWDVPGDVTAEYAYSELLVPEGEDQQGSFFMANGFGEGYFGMQVNTATERRILFSVWSPFDTNNPKAIPEDQRVLTAAKGDGVYIGEFGNEGAGGQSYLVYPWKAGVTCRFLTRVQPAANNFTVYTSWFSDSADDQWRLIASFRRPQTQTSLKRFHSFLENFNPATGHLSRRVQYSNVRVRDTAGVWHPCNSARFSTDATGSQRQRLDFDGGTEGDHFFLKNCGFFRSSSRPGTRFEIGPSVTVSPPPALPEQPL